MEAWLIDNLPEVLAGTGVSVLITYITYRFNTKVVPNFLESVQRMFAILVSNLFGVTFGEGQDIVEKLPVIGKFDDLAADIQLNNEIKLFELKKQLNSPLYTALEKVPIELMFNMLFEKMEKKVSNATIAALQALDEIEVGE